MTNPVGIGSEPPMEWVAAQQRWWLVRLVMPVAITAAACVLQVGLWFRLGAQTWTPLQQLGLDCIVPGAIAASSFLFVLLPSVRRIGISPTYLVVDTGFHTHQYTWPELRQIRRTQASRFQRNQLSLVSRTRISVGSGILRINVALSPHQGDRLAQFLRIP